MAVAVHLVVPWCWWCQRLLVAVVVVARQVDEDGRHRTTPLARARRLRAHSPRCHCPRGGAGATRLAPAPQPCCAAPRAYGATAHRARTPAQARRATNSLDGANTGQKARAGSDNRKRKHVAFILTPLGGGRRANAAGEHAGGPCEFLDYCVRMVPYHHDTMMVHVAPQPTARLLCWGLDAARWRWSVNPTPSEAYRTIIVCTIMMVQYCTVPS